MPEQGIIDKVRALLARADPDRNPNEHERDAAQRKAQELMFKHNLDHFMVEEETGEIRQDENVVEGVTKQWKGSLLFNVASANFVTAYKMKISRSKTIWMLTGRPDNIAFVKELTQHLIPWLEIEAAAGVKRDQPYNPKAYKRAFYDGAARRVRARLIGQQQEFADAAGGSGMEMVRRTEAQNLEYLRRQGVQLRSLRSRGYGNMSGRWAGTDAGNRADLAPGKKVRGGRRTAGELGRG